MGSRHCFLQLSLLVATLTFASPSSPRPTKNLHFTFIGNEAFLITDGETALLTDFPYRSGAFGYMTYDFTAIRAPENGLCLISHGHADHFDPGLFAKTKFAVIAPASVLAQLDTARKIPFEPEMTYRGIAVHAFRTPHGNIEHYSYLVQWPGVRMYFSGDTDDVSDLLRQTDLDLAFVTPWQLKALKDRNAVVRARQSSSIITAKTRTFRYIRNAAFHARMRVLRSHLLPEETRHQTMQVAPPRS